MKVNSTWRRLRKTFQPLADEYRDLARSDLRDIAWLVQRTARQLAPVGSYTYVDQAGNQHPGHLRKSIKANKVADGVWRVAVEAPYGRYVEYGTRPHVIRPKYGTVLSWIDKTTGERVYAREVHHPGTAPRPFWTPAVQIGRQEWKRRKRSLSKRVFRGW